MRITRKQLSLSIVAIAVSMLLVIPPSVSNTQQNTNPITKEALLESLRKKVLSSKELIGEVRQSGVAFRLTPTDEQEIRNAGKYLDRKGLDDLVAAVRSNYRVKKEATPEFHGLLTPANDPDPLSPCTRDPSFIAPPEAVTIFYGSSAAWITSPKLIVLRVKDTDLLAISRTSEGVSVSAQIYGADERIITQIIDNEFHINPNNYFRIDRTDRHTLIVYDQYNKQVLNVRFLNPRAIKVMGIFHFPDIPPISIGEQAITIGEGRVISNNCSRNDYVGIYLEP